MQRVYIDKINDKKIIMIPKEKIKNSWNRPTGALRTTGRYAARVLRLAGAARRLLTAGACKENFHPNSLNNT
jgi:hypothetical protein